MLFQYLCVMIINIILTTITTYHILSYKQMMTNFYMKYVYIRYFFYCKSSIGVSINLNFLSTSLDNE